MSKSLDRNIKSILSNDNINFLCKLSKEMKEQGTFGQAHPRYWVILEEDTVVTAEDYADNYYYVYEDFTIRNMSDLKYIIDEFNQEEYMVKIEDETLYIYEEVSVEDDDISEDEEYILVSEFHSLCDAIDELEYLGVIETNKFEPVYIRKEYKISKGPLFLTHKACVEYLEKYGYNHKNGKPYALTAFRSPEIESLYSIIMETNWESLKDKE